MVGAPLSDRYSLHATSGSILGYMSLVIGKTTSESQTRESYFRVEAEFDGRNPMTLLELQGPKHIPLPAHAPTCFESTETTSRSVLRA